MTPVQRNHLDDLENQSIFIFREAYHAFKNIAMPWSMGKDSNVLIWLARKAFLGRVPFPVLHIDTTYEFPEMLEFREWAIKHHSLNLIVKINTEARARGIGYETHDTVTVTHGNRRSPNINGRRLLPVFGVTRIQRGRRRDIFHHATRSLNGITRTSRPNSGASS
jgi:3'-phosphoadenosine 5'-phosphosulfate sulfotransferase (PAPS reductase)/FAD synthetase